MGENSEFGTTGSRHRLTHSSRYFWNYRAALVGKSELKNVSCKINLRICFLINWATLSALMNVSAVSNHYHKVTMTSLGQTAQQILNKTETKYINKIKTKYINKTETKYINKTETKYINKTETKYINKIKTKYINKTETKYINKIHKVHKQDRPQYKH